jgi:hypothetical protein
MRASCRRQRPRASRGDTARRDVTGHFVIAGLDPAIHHSKKMDPRVKLAGDQME